MVGASTSAKNVFGKGKLVYCNEMTYLIYIPEYMKCLYFVSVLQFHVHNTISFVFLVRNTIIVIFKYLQQSYKMINIKSPEVHRRQRFVFIYKISCAHTCINI